MTGAIATFGLVVVLPPSSSGGGSLVAFLALAAGLTVALLLPGIVASIVHRRRAARTAPREPDFESLLRQFETEVDRSLRDPVLVNQARRQLRDGGRSQASG